MEAAAAVAVDRSILQLLVAVVLAVPTVAAAVGLWWGKQAATCGQPWLYFGTFHVSFVV